MPKTISSVQNPRVKFYCSLRQKSSLREESGLFTLEGRREVERCAASGFRIQSLFVCPDIAQGFMAPEAQEVFEVSRPVYGKMACREGSEGVMAIAKARRLTLGELSLPASPLVVVLESVEKPGNLGAVLRSADAAGADAVLICDPLTDIFNPNTIRASLGTTFSVKTVACTSVEAVQWLKAKGIQILTAQLQDSSYYYDVDMKKGTALVMGNEATGLSSLWREAADAHIKIPMLGLADSLNVSVSTAILLYEAVRQRQK